MAIYIYNVTFKYARFIFVFKLCIHSNFVRIFKYAPENYIFEYLRIIVPFEDDPVTAQTSDFLTGKADILLIILM